MSKITRIKAAMTPFPHWIDAGEPLLTARDMMQQFHVRHLPVKDDGELVSIITDRDLKFVMDENLGLPPREAMQVRNLCVYAAYVVFILPNPIETPGPVETAIVGGVMLLWTGLLLYYMYLFVLLPLRLADCQFKLHAEDPTSTELLVEWSRMMSFAAVI